MEKKETKIAISKMQIKSEKDIWIKDGRDYILHLGNMKKAVVVAYYIGGFYSISPRSYFPFYGNNYEVQFSSADECKKYAIEIIKEWLKSIIIS